MLAAKDLPQQTCVGSITPEAGLALCLPSLVRKR